MIQVWWTLINFDELWWTLMNFDKLWWTLMNFDELWWTLMNFDERWWTLMNFDEIWWALMNYDDFSFDFASNQCLFLLRSITSLSSSIVLIKWLIFKIKLVLGWPANLLFMLFIFCSILMTDQAIYLLTTEMKFYSQSLWLKYNRE